MARSLLVSQDAKSCRQIPPEARAEFKALVIDVRDAPDCETGKKRLEDLVAKKEREFPEACRCLKDDFDASLNHLHVPTRHRQMVRTTNLVERTLVEERRPWMHGTFVLCA